MRAAIRAVGAVGEEEHAARRKQGRCKLAKPLDGGRVVHDVGQKYHIKRYHRSDDASASWRLSPVPCDGDYGARHVIVASALICEGQCNGLNVDRDHALRSGNSSTDRKKPKPGPKLQYGSTANELGVIEDVIRERNATWP